MHQYFLGFSAVDAQVKQGARTGFSEELGKAVALNADGDAFFAMTIYNPRNEALGAKLAYLLAKDGADVG
jgi:hypothetical protein